jgi:hypothetical protein
MNINWQWKGYCQLVNKIGIQIIKTETYRLFSNRVNSNEQ